MSGIPRGVLTERLQEAVGARRVRAAVFCTFRFEPAFFEQEVLPALFDRPFHHVPAVRRLQLEEDLRPLSGRFAVYYDPRALLVGDRGSAALDVRRIPVRPRSGYFHPKNALVLLEDEAGAESLLVLTTSANLTRAGWWENVEVAHLEELPAAGRSRMRDELLSFVDQLRRMTATVGEHESLDAIRRFVRRLTQPARRSGAGVLHHHFLANGRPGASGLADFIADVAGDAVTGANLEIISPYVDDADASQPLAELVDRFQPRQLRVLLPERNEMARCRQSLYEHVRQLGGRWSRLPATVTSGGDRGAAPRTVHAKVYRFFTPDREVLVIGSANLTRAGHQATGNVETVVLVEADPGRRRRGFWLEPVEEPPAFLPAAEEDEDAEGDPVPLVLRYDWGTGRAEAQWQGPVPCPRLEVTAHGVPLFAVDGVPPGQWRTLPRHAADALERQLRTSSFLTVFDPQGRRSVLLVLETGMAHRPSLLLDLTPAEILQYWSLLTPDQRAAYLAGHGDRAADADGGEALVAKATHLAPVESMFDRFAGIFHGFAALQRTVLAALEQNRAPEAVFRVFGAKYDSLRTLAERVAGDEDGDPVDRYLLLLCAEQLVQRLRMDWPSFWRSDPPGARRLRQALDARSDLRAQLVARNGPDMAEFLDWYDKRFLAAVEEAPA